MFLINWMQQYKQSFRRSEKIFYLLKEQLYKKSKKVPKEIHETFHSLLKKFEKALKQKDAQKAFNLKEKALLYYQSHYKKDLRDFFDNWVLGLGGVLLVVALINQVWFQNYQIPSGSMRPTLMEKDRLIASKTAFGVNLPFAHRPLFFNSKQIKRGNLVIFENPKLSKKENESRYLFIFPAKKQFVKRLIGKPGDHLYFYGGKIYGLDKDGNEIPEFHHSDAFEPLEHIPFTTFEGKVLSAESHGHSKISYPVYLYQMDQLVGKMTLQSGGNLQGQFYHNSNWIPESQSIRYQDLWGIKNYAMARILSAKEAEGKVNNLTSETGYYLELLHSPSFEQIKPHLGPDYEGRLRPRLSGAYSYFPLSSVHFQRLKDAMTTSRLVFSKGYAGNYQLGSTFKPYKFSPYFEGIPDGTYEMIKGVAYEVKKSGEQVKLSSDHPLNAEDPALIQRLFNLGMQMSSLFERYLDNPDFFPPRYAYFRDQNLYAMGKPIALEGETELLAFNQNQQQERHPFKDHGAPLNSDGSLNKELIKNFGLVIPEGHYLCLGDNHAGSRDCRDWGFISENNIQGSPALIFWPHSSRFGIIKQNHLCWKNGPTLFISAIGFSLLFISIYRGKKAKDRPL